MDVVALDAPSLREWIGLTGHEPAPFGPETAELTWGVRAHHVGLRDDDGALVAIGGATIARVTIAGHPAFDVVGIGGVIIGPDARGRGLGRVLMDGLARLAQGLGPKRAMIFCEPPLAGLYARRGYAEIADPVWVDQPGGRRAMPLVAMWRPLHPGPDWPPGRVDVDGLPF